MRTATRLTACLLCLFTSEASADLESAPAPEKLAGLEMVIQTGHLRTVRDLAFSGDSRYILSGSGDETMKLWDAESGSLLRTFHCESVVDDVAFVPDGRRVMSYDDVGGVVVWDRITGKKLQTIATERGQGKDLFVLSDGRTIVFGHGEDTVEVWDIDTHKRLKRFTNRCNIKHSWMSLSLLSDEKRILTTCRDGTVKLWDLESGKIHWTSRLSDKELGGKAAASLDMRFVFTGRRGGYPGYPPKEELRVLDLETGKLKRSYNLKALIHNIVPLPDNRRVMIMLGPPRDGEVVLFDFVKGKVLRTYENACDTQSFASDLMGASPNMRQFVVPDKMSNLRTWDIETGETVHTLGGKAWGRIARVGVSDNGWQVAAASGDGNIYVWNALTASLTYALPGSPRQWATSVLYSPDGRFIAAEGFTNESQGANDFRVWNARSGELVSHYRSLYERRLQKFGLSEQDLQFAFNRAPDAKILSLKQEGKRAELTFELTDSGSELLRYNVFVNDVPLFGADGKAVSGHSERITETVELTYGRNKIEISALNKLGIESLRDHRIVEYSQKVSGDLYYLGFGVSKYADEKLNLKYVSKDALDLETILKRTKGVFNEVHTRVFSDADVTRDAFHQARMFLAGAGVDDTVVLFVAGHGVYDAGEAVASLSLAKDHKLIGRGIQRKHLSDSKRNAIKKAFFDQNRYIYNDLFRRSGAIVLSSSQGAEWSYESDAIENGVFTEEVIRALTSKSADENRDRLVSTEELRDYVTRAVAEKTAGLQHPVVDRDNLENVFALPVVGR
jgi:WD40 repeat protein